MSRLIVASGHEEGMVFPLQAAIVSIGRSATNAIQIVDKRISRHHAEVIFSEGHYIYRDLNSKNGSLVNNQPIKKAVVLQHGDEIRLGDTRVMFELDPSEDRMADRDASGVRLVEDDTGAFARERITVKDALGGVRGGAAVAEKPITREGQAQLQILYDVAEAVRSIFDLNQLFHTLMDIIFKVMEPDRGTILTLDRQTGALVPRLTRRRHTDSGELKISLTIVERAIQDQAGLLIADALHDQRFAKSESIVMQDIRAAMCAPMIFRDEVLGVIYIDTTSRANAYTKSDLALLTGITNQAALAFSNTELIQQVFLQKRLEREMEIARDIQMNLLPHVYPDVPGFEFSAMSLPAKRVGGDYYDFMDLGGGRLGVCVADVSGKGVPAAIVLSTMRTALKLLLQQNPGDLAGVIAQLNRIICQDTTEEMFVTIVLGVIDSMNSRFEYCNAGHCSPLLYIDGNLMELESQSPVVGIVEQTEYQTESVPLPSGSLMLLTTDGVTDIMNPAGDLFTRKALSDFMRANAGLPVREFRDALYHRLLAHKNDAEQFDDMTMVVIRRKN
jgi:phosphoserine phosphatase RsbU/P